MMVSRFHQSAGQHLRAEGGRQVHGVDAPVPHQRMGVAPHLLVEDVKLLSQQHPEDLQPGGIEGEGMGVRRPQRAGAVAPPDGLQRRAVNRRRVGQQQVQKRAVGVHHALRPPGGAGGEDDGGDMGGRQGCLSLRRRDGRAGQGGAGGQQVRIVQAQRLQPGGQPPGHRGPGQRATRRGVLAHHRQPLGGIIEVQRQMGGAARQHGQHGDHHVGGARDRHRHHVAGADAARDQPPCQPRNGSRQRREADAGFAEHQRRGPRRLGGLTVQHL